MDNARRETESARGRTLASYGLIFATAILLVVAGVWILRTFEPTNDSWFPKCVFYRWTGLHCPGCGGTRALRALVFGDFARALRCNALLVVGFPVSLGLIAWQRRQERRGVRSMPYLSAYLAILFTAFMVLRNLPSPTTSWLAPPASSPSSLNSTEHDGNRLDVDSL